MKPYVKMMLMNSGNGGDQRRDSSRRSPRSEYDGGRMEYDMRMEDDRGDYGDRPRMGGGYEVDSRFRDRRGHEHYDNGRFAPMPSRRGGRRRVRSEGGGPVSRMDIGPRMDDDDDEDEMRGDFWPMPPYTVPPYGEGENMNEIGFERGMNSNYESGDEMTNRRSEKVHGYAEGANEFTHETAKEWTSSMKNKDGSKGPHWTMDQIKQVMSQRGIKQDPAVFWSVINSIYSDFCATSKKHGVNNMDYYVDMAIAWIEDPDAVKDKPLAYYTYVVKHE